MLRDQLHLATNTATTNDGGESQRTMAFALSARTWASSVASMRHGSKTWTLMAKLEAILAKLHRVGQQVELVLLVLLQALSGVRLGFGAV